jgi:hypothetical protein
VLTQRSRRGGWTRIDLLVAVVIGLTALGVVVYLVFRTRTPADTVECAMHLKRLGEAIHKFSDEHKMLPSSCQAPGEATWAVQIAAYLKEHHGVALAKWDPKLPYYEQDRFARDDQVWIYYCPARRQPPLFSRDGDIDPKTKQLVRGALGDYGCTPTTDNDKRPWMSPEADGALIVGDARPPGSEAAWKSRTKLESLKRGLAYTTLLGEKHIPEGGFGKEKFGDTSLYNGANPAAFARLVDKDHPLAQGPTDAYKVNFGSWHPGKCQFLMADTSVRPFANDVNPLVVRQLIPRTEPEDAK